jgi:hypothetical protein
VPDQPSNPQRETNESESSASRILTFQLQEISSQVQERLASNAPIFAGSTDLEKGLEIVSTTLDVFSGVTKPEEVNKLKGRIAALQTDLRETKHLALKERIKQAFVDQGKKIEALHQRLDKLISPYPSLDHARSSPEFGRAAEPIWIDYVAQTGEFDSLTSDFARELPVSKLEERLSQASQKARKRACKTWLRSLGYRNHR